MIDAPSPCTARDPTSISIPQAAPQRADAAVKTDNPRMNSLRRPNRVRRRAHGRRSDEHDVRARTQERHDEVVGLARVRDQSIRRLNARQSDDAVDRLDEVREQPFLRKAERPGVQPRELFRQLERRQPRRLPEEL